MKYDLIIVSKSVRPELTRLTQQCINTAKADNADLNIIIVETGFHIVDYKADQYILYNGKFKYNHALNLGLEKAIGDIHILANNDLVFHPGWSVIGEQMIANGFDSACALSSCRDHRIYERGDFIYPGYEVGKHMAGWCIFATKECIKKIGQLDETYDFWYSDNAYADQLQKAGIKHGLFCNVQVDHVTSATLKTLPPREQRRYSFGAKRLYDLRNAV